MHQTTNINCYYSLEIDYKKLIIMQITVDRPVIYNNSSRGFLIFPL